jgi:hypothetical protein
VTELAAAAAGPAAGFAARQIHQQVRAALAPHLLDLAEITRQRDLYAPGPDTAQTLAHLSAGRTVALVGAPGTGRRIAAINALVRFGAWPSQVTLDPQETVSFSAAPGHGYLLDAAGPGAPGLRAAIQRALATARAANCFVIVRATQAGWRELGLAGQVPAVELRPAAAIAVFRRHLAQRSDEDQARYWSQQPQIRGWLLDAAPAAAAGLAATVAAVLSQGPRPAAQQLDDIAQARLHWAGHLAQWYRHGHPRPDVAGRRRTLLIATAVLERSQAALVFTAAGQLARLLDLPPEPGHGLAAGQAAPLLATVDAVLAGGRAEFPRPGYGAAVLDDVWACWPQLRGDLARWLARLPAALPADAAVRAVASLVSLCARQHDHYTLFFVAGQWLSQPRTRGLGLAAITLAGLSEPIGPASWARLREWSSDPAWRLAATEVCGGGLGVAFPHLALARLRLAAQHGDAADRASVAAALTRLACTRQARLAVLDTLLAWLRDSREPGPRQAAQQALLRILGTAGPDGGLLIIGAPAQPVTGRLATGWRELLRAAETRMAACAIAADWLESLLQNATQRPAILATLVAICRSEIDTGLLVPVISRCAKLRAAGPGHQLLTELRGRISEVSPLSTDHSLAIALSLGS